MDDKRTLELSDEALDRVAGGLSMGSSLPGTTYSTSGPAAAGPGAGPSDSRDTIDRTALASKGTDMLHGNNLLHAQMVAAGTIEQYWRDYEEYIRQHDEWRKKYTCNGGLTPNAGSAPVPPNPYDYL